MTGVREFRVDVCATRGQTVVTVTGEIDLSTSPALRDALEEALAGWPHRLEVDFTRVTFCDCTGLNALLAARIAAGEAGASFTLINVNAPIVIRLFCLAEVGPLFGLGLAVA
ncbi:STAS domain-containing protein [Streptomyces goshikiensis]|uniref:STAS domain-containing protein n=1 Tax=Streptomyces goshikiensis TaxID=1942 RepID=UPI00364D71A8